MNSFYEWRVVEKVCSKCGAELWLSIGESPDFQDCVDCDGLALRPQKEKRYSCYLPEYKNRYPKWVYCGNCASRQKISAFTETTTHEYIE